MNINALNKLSYGVYIVSAMDGTRPTGCVANSTMQITSSPATIAVSINHGNYTNDCIRKTGKFSVSVLGEHSSADLIGTFGFRSARDINKYSGVEHETHCDVPVVADCCAWMVFSLTGSYETSTHTVFFGILEDAEIVSDDTPMTYAYYHNVIKGKSPKTAPTYIEDAPAAPASPEVAAPAASGIMVCDICKYEYTGDIPFDELPDDWTCPICGMGKSVFKAK